MRRCVFFHIEPQKGTELEEIIKARLPELFEEQSALFNEAILIFEDLRRERHYQSGLSTAELLDWLQILTHWPEKENKPLHSQPELLKATIGALLKDNREQESAVRQNC